MSLTAAALVAGHAEADPRPLPATCVHLNAAGASVMAPAVLQALHAHLDREAQQGGYDAGYHAQSEVDACYAELGALLGVPGGDLAFADSGSRGWAMVLAALPFPPGSRLLFTDCEYAGNWHAARWLARSRGWRLEVLPVAVEADLETPGVLDRLGPDVKLLASVHVPSNNGLVAPVERLGEALRERAPQALHLVDVCQSFGQLPVSVATLHADLLVGTGRKYLRGPRGSAFLYVGERVASELQPALLDTYSARSEQLLEPWPGARCFETWECYVGGKIGLGAAAGHLARLDRATAFAKIRRSAQLLRELLTRVRGVRVLDLGDPAARSGLVTFTVRNQEPRRLWAGLTERGFRLDTCQISGSLLAPRVPGVDGALRASVHYYTVERELEAFVQTLAELTGSDT